MKNSKVMFIIWIELTCKLSGFNVSITHLQLSLNSRLYALLYSTVNLTSGNTVFNQRIKFIITSSIVLLNTQLAFYTIFMICKQRHSNVIISNLSKCILRLYYSFFRSPYFQDLQANAPGSDVRRANYVFLWTHTRYTNNLVSRMSEPSAIDNTGQYIQDKSHLKPKLHVKTQSIRKFSFKKKIPRHSRESNWNLLVSDASAIERTRSKDFKSVWRTQSNITTILQVNY